MFILASRLLLTLKILELLPFSGSFNVIVRLSNSMSYHNRRKASPFFIAVSLSNSKNVPSFGPLPAIKEFIFFSVGIKGSFLETLQSVGSHLFPCILRNSVYVAIAECFLELLHSCLAMTSLMLSELRSCAPLSISNLRIVVFKRIVVFA